MFSTRTPTSRAAVALVASLALFGLAACGGGSDDAKTEKTASATPAPAETTADSAAASGDLPDWAKPATQVGDKIATVKAGDITVDVYQVGVTQATKTGQFVDPETNKPIIDEGDDIVFVNYVITNTGAPIDLGASLVDVQARYKDWKFMQGMDSIVDSALFEQENVNTEGFAPGKFKEPAIFTFGKGQSYSVGENFRYQKNSPITFKVGAVPVDDKADLLHDDKVEGEGSGTIK
ncbi:hypothetical protein C6I20_05160 [Aeromicrobium sp. A1-2]|uniref:hypothetical protein n=1 Tax=Aeromicrobium sp. A1-2 TaxID=2107713 RepID=UPI000E4F74C8|nr:hypothetical protein [Aeromicrobium sp. A1-2]AXT84642.1 hypothetical protein C6I20_05160 [Aeromicrobium sp. A1-2]